MSAFAAVPVCVCVCVCVVAGSWETAVTFCHSTLQSGDHYTGSASRCVTKSPTFQTLGTAYYWRWSAATQFVLNSYSSLHSKGDNVAYTAKVKNLAFQAFN